ncbi:MAG: hypothetical protein V1676_06120 [Candidatus Diapherotrites archaeon]
MLCKKTLIFLCMEDVLTPGRVSEKVDVREVKKILQNLHALEGKGTLALVLLSGSPEEKTKKTLKEHGFAEFFKPENVFAVAKGYLDSKSEADRLLYEKNIAKDPQFKDEYFKQHVIMEFIRRGEVPKERMLLLGHDLLTDGFYTLRFSGIDFALLEDAHSERHAKKDAKIKGLVYFRRTWGGVRKLISYFPEHDYSGLEKFIFEELREHLCRDTKLGALAAIGKRG